MTYLGAKHVLSLKKCHPKLKNQRVYQPCGLFSGLRWIVALRVAFCISLNEFNKDTDSIEDVYHDHSDPVMAQQRH
jgi:hypothetical protein